MSNYHNKYLKYKNKYIDLLNKIGGMPPGSEPEEFPPVIDIDNDVEDDDDEVDYSNYLDYYNEVDYENYDDVMSDHTLPQYATHYNPQYTTFPAKYLFSKKKGILVKEKHDLHTIKKKIDIQYKILKKNLKKLIETKSPELVKIEEEIKVSKERIKSLSSTNKCIICQENNALWACLPCCHKILCDNCYAGYKPTECDICRQQVQKYIKPTCVPDRKSVV